MPRIKKAKVPKVKDEPKLEPAPVSMPEPEKLVPQDEPKLEAPVQEVAKSPEDSDYLRKYQYKNVNNNPTVGGSLTDPDPGSKAEIMKKGLLSQQRVSIFVPKAETEDPKIKLSVTLNGYRLDLPKNVYLEVPLQIAEVIRESLNQQASALLPFQINRNKATESALS